jgi:RND superfamily putative drug exporter
VFALNLITGLGLGLAIDYSLLMVSRYREEAALTGFGYDAVRRTLATSGRTIAFSAVTVSAALATLMIFPQSFLHSMGIAGAVVALMAALLAIGVLPAVLILLGPRVDALAPGWLQRAAGRDARTAESGWWYRLSQFVIARPWRVALTTVALLVALGLPFAAVKFLPVTAGELPSFASARQVDTALSDDFPPGRTAPIEVVLGVPVASPQAKAFTSRIRSLPGVSAVEVAEPAGKHLSVVNVFPATPTYSNASRDLVRTIRRLHPPFSLGVAGETAAFVDLEHSLGSHLPIVLLLVTAVTVLVLFFMTGSLVLGAKAVLMNVLSLSAVYGVLVLTFQHGRLQGVLSYHSTGALDATQPVLLFAICFGLATDYGVLLLSRIKEARDAGIPDREAVAIGLERTGRIVTAAALLFAVAVGAFTTSKLVFIKELGFGTALAVLVDAFIIRALLVPALMTLLGEWNWWSPGPLRRLAGRRPDEDTGRYAPSTAKITV